MALKRVIDLLLAAMGLFVLFPVMLLLALLVRLRLGSPVLFRQPRLGLDEQSFRIVKFRSMNDRRGVSGELLSDAERLTPFGSRLRSWSLDELPELWNVLRGEMSLVGPRPPCQWPTSPATAEERRRHEV